ncbi:MAG: TRAP transporter small permease subunit [Planctomycetaceae bacterium]|nr:TRAP transporter small permease subunit [Planctomycetaceae bacterium]
MGFANTMMRYLFSSGIIMGEELVRYLFVWATFLAVISVSCDHKHIAGRAAPADDVPTEKG